MSRGMSIRRATQLLGSVRQGVGLPLPERGESPQPHRFANRLREPYYEVATIRYMRWLHQADPDTYTAAWLADVYGGSLTGVIETLRMSEAAVRALSVDGGKEGHR